MQPANLGAEQPGNLIAHRSWVHVYLNGLYWGLYDMTERIDENFARAYGDSDADYDVISQSGGVVDGDRVSYNNLLTICIVSVFSVLVAYRTELGTQHYF